MKGQFGVGDLPIRQRDVGQVILAEAKSAEFDNGSWVQVAKLSVPWLLGNSRLDGGYQE